MFNLASRLKPWIKFSVQNKPTRVIVARTQQREQGWNYKDKVFHVPWNYWKYAIMLVPSLTETHTGNDINASHVHAIKALKQDEKLGFVNDHVAMVATMHSIMGWLRVASHAESTKDDNDHESNKESPLCARLRRGSSEAGELSHAENIIARLIKGHAIVVFSKSYCPFCKKTKVIFRDASVRPQYVELDQQGDGEYIQDALLKMTGRRTVPQVFIYGVFVGGCSDLENLKESGKLHEILKHIPP